MLSLNVHVDNWWEGCRFHDYPYEAEVPISGEKNRVFKCDEDVWDVVKLLIAETKETNKKMGKDFDIIGSVSFQLPFFSCMNIILNKEFQRDISKYLYCQKFNIPPCRGIYEDQSHRWTIKSNIIETAMSKREEQLRRKTQKEMDTKKGNINV